ncbi:MAG TPA: polymer-forming cytoskeletal protein [Pyrinomonadaceae bacterium]|nr:polymer-forming cytoskeletal protein [Pyrinomonadaceae bacterium]
MGRGSVKDQPNTSENYQEQTPGSFYQNSGNVQPQPARAVSESESMARDIKEGRLSGYVGNGTVLTGETNFQAMLRVDGHLTGRVTSENGTLIVGSTGRVDANIAVAAAVVNGTVNGDIIASEKLELGRSARLVGNVQTPRIVVEEGAIFEGNCSMLKAKEAADKRHAAMKAGYAPVEESAEEVRPEDDSPEVAEAAAI